jgi:hypothetical protein
MKRTKIGRDDYELLVANAAEGDAEALRDLRQVLAANPTLYRALGDLNGHVRRHLIQLAAPSSLDTQESLRMVLARKRDELLAEGDSLPEQLLIDQVLTTMLDAACCQLGRSQAHSKEKTERRWERKLTRAQERHQAAIHSLVEVRRMLQCPGDA